MKILLIFTGGTIGSTVSGGTIAPGDASSITLVDRYSHEHDNLNIDFDIITPLNILSENILIDDWNTLIHAINLIDFSKYDGIILTHGSDTLQYTSALLGMLFSWIPIPFVIIASNYALSDIRSNGYDNFKSAVTFISTSMLRGVYTIFSDVSNNVSQNIVYLSTRLVEADGYSDRFESFGKIPFGEIIDDNFIRYNDSANPTLEEINLLCEDTRILYDIDSLDLSNNIILIKPYPGLDYRTITTLPDTKAIIHTLYHSSTACTIMKNTSITEFIKKSNVPVYIAPVKDIEDKYLSSINIERENVHKLYNISSESAYIKLLIAYNQKEMNVDEFLSHNLFFEHVRGRF